MSEIHVRRIRSILERDYVDLIDTSDIPDGGSSDSIVLSRSLAAFSLAFIAQVDPKTAANHVTDGFDDNGIDAFLYDEELGTAYIVQAKWVNEGLKSPDLASIGKTVSGFRDLIAAKYDKFNQKVNALSPEIDKALDSTDVDFVILVAYTGTQPLSKHAERELSDLLDELNDPMDIVSYRTLSQKELYAGVSGSLEGVAITLEDVTIYDWGYLGNPYYAVYGQIQVEEVARWFQQHDMRLFARNLRKFKGDTSVNRAIKHTLTSEPGKFWYFNNGITVLAEKIDKKPKGGSNRDKGEFVFEGVSVVNGAQTVGVIANTVMQGFPKAAEARVLVRFISLENCPPGFATEVTTATNTQNRIERRDFASLDPTQERLRDELMLDLGKVYIYKSGDSVPHAQEGCTIDDATIALACSQPDLSFAANAKRNISRLWESIDKEPYTVLFNSELSAVRMWRSVQVARSVEARLNQERGARDGTSKRVAIHGNRFILHRVFRAMPLENFDDPDFGTQSFLASARDLATKELEQIVPVIEENYQDVYLNNFFKSAKKLKSLADRLPDLSGDIPKVPYYQQEAAQQPSLFDTDS